jgi:hypothetical protein
MGDSRTIALGKNRYDSEETKALYEGPSSRQWHHRSRFFPTDSISSVRALSCKSAWKGDA